MAGKGGRREGAGRKPKAITRLIHETPIQAAEGMIRDRLPWLIGKLFELAEGVHVEKVVGREGATIVYQERPDRQAAEYLIDRVMGKPTQPVDVYDEARRLATERGLDPAKVVSIYEALKKKRAV